MGGNPQPQPGAADGGQIGTVQILLPQMQPIAAQVDGQLPMVIHHQRSAMVARQLLRGGDLGPQQGGILGFQAQLHQLDPASEAARHPSGAVENRVKPRQGHARKAFPMTGVEGTAIWRGSIGSAR